jgi:catalase
MFSKVGKKTDLLVRFSTVAGERIVARRCRQQLGRLIKSYYRAAAWDP